MNKSATTLKPDVRGPVDSARRTPEDPPPPRAADDVANLASPEKLERIQADNRLRTRGADGVLAAARYLGKADAKPDTMVEAVGFISRADMTSLDSGQAAEVRQLLAGALGNSSDDVRAASARALQIQGPGEERTAFLRAIGDKTKRVRWAIVDRFGDNPTELTRAQLVFLIGFLQAGTAEEFDDMDADKNSSLSKAEFLRGEDRFERLDSDRDLMISRQEWTNPVESAIRADVYHLLVTLHQKRTPQNRPVVYNAYLPAGEQQEPVNQWLAWAQTVPDTP